MSKVYLVSYCDDSDIKYLKSRLDSDDIVVGVDQGIAGLTANNVPFQYGIGDFDSFDECLLSDSIKIIKLDREKDCTDLEYAVHYFAKHEICIINNLQGRIDHTLAALSLLESYDNTYIMSAKQEIHLAKKHFSANLPIGTTISLIPISEQVKNIKTQGLYYPLENETLYRKKSRGISNKNVDNFIDILFLDGELLIVINKELS